jgi:hypothetical protein
MDALSISLSLFKFTSSTLVLVSDFATDAQIIAELDREVAILHEILHESTEICHLYNLPESIKRSLELCQQKRLVLGSLISRDLHLHAGYDKFIRFLRQLYLYQFKEHRVLKAYKSFRDAVLLLRDLSAE